jgi:hypothetical protein
LDAQHRDRLIEKGKQTGGILYSEIRPFLQERLVPDELAAVIDIFEQYGISVIDDVPPRTCAPNGHRQRDPALLALLRTIGVPAADAISHRDDDGRLFEGALLVPGRATVSAWVTLRSRLDVLPHWPVIRAHHEADYFFPDELTPTSALAAAVAQMGDEDFQTDGRYADPAQSRLRASELTAKADGLAPEPWCFQEGHRAPGPIVPAVFDPPVQPPDNPDCETLAWILDQDLLAARDVRGRPRIRYSRIDLAPTPVPWEVFAYWPYGGWNDAPSPVEQLTMVRHWYHQVRGGIDQLPGRILRDDRLEPADVPAGGAPPRQ